jgi:hypothetical protein
VEDEKMKLQRRLFLVWTILGACFASRAVVAQSPNASDPTHVLSSKEVQSAFTLPGKPNRPHVMAPPGVKTLGANPAAYGNFTYLPYHGGPIMQTSRVYLIFWEPPKLQDGRASGVASNYNYGMYQYVVDVNGSRLLGTQTQYWMNVGGYRYNVKNKVSYGGYYLDTTPYPKNACWNQITGYNCVRDDWIQYLVKKAIYAKGWPNGGYNNIYIVYTGKGEGGCDSISSNGVCISAAYRDYCGYHNYFEASSGAPVLYADIAYPDSLASRNCYSGIATPSPHGAVIDAALDVTSHEHMETITDPIPGTGWVEITTANTLNENGDKCNWVFYPRRYGASGNIIMNNHYYLLQDEFSDSHWAAGLYPCVSQ